VVFTVPHYIDKVARGFQQHRHIGTCNLIIGSEDHALLYVQAQADLLKRFDKFI